MNEKLFNSSNYYVSSQNLFVKNFIYVNFTSFLFGLKFGQTHQQSENIKPFFNNLVTSYIEAYNINS